MLCYNICMYNTVTTKKNKDKKITQIKNILTIIFLLLLNRNALVFLLFLKVKNNE